MNSRERLYLENELPKLVDRIRSGEIKLKDALDEVGKNMDIQEGTRRSCRMQLVARLASSHPSEFTDCRPPK